LDSLPEINVAALTEWMRQKSLPEYATKRLLLFLEEHDAKRYESATYIGIPLMDELARWLFDDRDFTSKRGKQPRPQIACKTHAQSDLENYHKRFVQEFGSVQSDVDDARLTDENYWNRHAILHGRMQRSMGRKDSAKCLMAILFLIHSSPDVDEN
jgi:hypothetical protein